VATEEQNKRYDYFPKSDVGGGEARKRSWKGHLSAVKNRERRKVMLRSNRDI